MLLLLMKLERVQQEIKWLTILIKTQQNQL